MARRLKKKFIYLSIVILAFFLLFIPNRIFSPVKLKIVRITSQSISILSFPLKELKKILYYHRTFNEYKRLEREVNALKGRLIGLEEVIRENTRFERLLEFKRNLIFSSVMANVIGRDPTNWNASIVIDRGRESGLAQGMPVVHASGVVGKVAEINSDTSRVILLNDPQFSVAALVQRPRESGLITGTLLGNCRLKYVSPNANIEIGDKVITSKLSSSFPEGILIGEVIDIKSNPGSSEAEYIVKPSVSLSKLEEVLIIQK